VKNLNQEEASEPKKAPAPEEIQGTIVELLRGIPPSGGSSQINKETKREGISPNWFRWGVGLGVLRC